MFSEFDGQSRCVMKYVVIYEMTKSVMTIGVTGSDITFLLLWFKPFYPWPTVTNYHIV